MTSESEASEIRLNQRVPLRLPAQVEVRVDRTFVWDEETRLADVSAFGASFSLTRPVKRGRLLQMKMPMPRQLRCYDYMAPEYQVWGLIRRCIPVVQDELNKSFSVGVAFIGKMPPQQFTNDPSYLFELAHKGETGLWEVDSADLLADESHLPKDVRRHSRLGIPVTVFVEVLDADGTVLESEVSITENISQSGACIHSTLCAEAGAFVRVTSEEYKAQIIAVVRNRRPASNGIVRLHVEFIDAMFPLQGIES